LSDIKPWNKQPVEERIAVMPIPLDKPLEAEPPIAPDSHLEQPNQPTLNQNEEPKTRKPLRLWPGVAAAVLILLAWFAVPFAIPSLTLYGLMGGAIGVLAIIVWWVFFSRAPWLDRLGVLVLMVLALIATKVLVHISISNGAMGMLVYALAIPYLCLALVAWAAATNRFGQKRRLSNGLRRGSLVIVVILICGAFMLVRTGGFTGSGDNDFHWRWSQTPEDRLLAQSRNEAAARRTALPASDSKVIWPGFRGPDRDGVVHGVKIATDWSRSKPVELWRRPIGPGWSSFAVRGDVVYTQEQRGEDEMVTSYNLNTGEPVWMHRDAARFWESNAGAGPRGTPTLSDGRVYTLGATGILNVLNADDGSVVWSRNAASDTQVKQPTWGFSSSPLVIGDMVVVAMGGTLAAYDLATGQPRWTGPKNGCCYSSPHRATIGGVEQIVLMNGPGTISVSPDDGRLLWEHAMPTGARIVQPALTAEGDLLLSIGESSDLQRISVANGAGGWTVTERWTSEGLKPYFSDFVVHKGHAYGFDGTAIACIDLENGERKWAGGNYGSGQLVLLGDQDVLLIISELGSLALVSAVPDGFKELAQFPAIKGKTWNHPVLAGDVLLVRNGEEMAAFRLAKQGR
jgi:outer membrane protein assembly factor BamB